MNTLIKETLGSPFFINMNSQLFKTMASEGRAARSASGASMSKYDVEVEGRLKKIEAAIKTIQSDITALKSDCAAGGSGDASSVEAKLDDLIARLGRKMSI